MMKILQLVENLIEHRLRSFLVTTQCRKHRAQESRLGHHRTNAARLFHERHRLGRRRFRLRAPSAPLLRPREHHQR